MAVFRKMIIQSWKWVDNSNQEIKPTKVFPRSSIFPSPVHSRLYTVYVRVQTYVHNATTTRSRERERKWNKCQHSSRRRRHDVARFLHWQCETMQGLEGKEARGEEEFWTELLDPSALLNVAIVWHSMAIWGKDQIATYYHAAG